MHEKVSELASCVQRELTVHLDALLLLEVSLQSFELTQVCSEQTEPVAECAVVLGPRHDAA